MVYLYQTKAHKTLKNRQDKQEKITLNTLKKNSSRVVLHRYTVTYSCILGKAVYRIA